MHNYSRQVHLDTLYESHASRCTCVTTWLVLVEKAVNQVGVYTVRVYFHELLENR